MADRYLVVDDITGKYKRGTAVGASLNVQDQDFDMAGGTALVTLSLFAFDGASKLDVLVNGKMERENVDWTRDTDNQRIAFTYTPPAGSWVRVRKWY